jgi:2'-5' RNA ligase
MNPKRIQLTLFVDDKDSEAIEQIRSTFNPVQYDLIKSHVTLCRENELAALEKITKNLLTLNHDSINIHFGKVARFSGGKGVLIPAMGDHANFQSLRKSILKGIFEEPGKMEPHITLMHPRNSICTDDIFEQIQKVTLPNMIEFRKISLILQENGDKWKVVKEFSLSGIN